MSNYEKFRMKVFNLSDINQTIARILTVFWGGMALWLFNDIGHFEKPGFISRLDYLIYDLRFPLAQQKMNKRSSTPVVIIDVDEKSLAELGQWPWSRVKMAQLVESAYSAGVVMMGFDMVFSEPERDSVAAWYDRKTITATEKAFLAQWQKEWQPEKVFAQALGQDTILGYVFHNEKGIEQGQLPAPLNLVQTHSHSPQLLAHQTMTNFTSNLPILMDTALSAGFFSTSEDHDGIIRRVPLILKYQNQFYSSLSLEIVKQFWLTDDVAIKTVEVGHEVRVESLHLGQYQIPTDANAQVLVPYVGPARSFLYLSASDFIVRPESLPKHLLEGAIALVGASAWGLEDLRSTPMGGEYPGVEVHANVINAILNTLDGGEHFPYRPDYANEMALWLILLMGVLALFFPLFSPWLLVVTLTGLFLGLIGLNLSAWRYALMDFPLAAQIIFWVGLCVINLPLCYMRQNRQKQQLQKMFGQYVPAAHIREMMSSEASFGFDGETKCMTVMFSDIRNFTSLSETLSAQELKDLLNRYFTPVTEVIFNYQGTIDKYVGDMVMAFWGAPMEDELHAYHAVESALKMLEVIEELGDNFRAAKLPPINVGIGLNTGDMNVGDMGSTYRRAYTVLGDSVNLASRLEALTKYYGVSLLVGEATKAQAPQFVYRKIDCLRVKGKQEPVTVYEPLGRIGEVSDETLAKTRVFETVLEAYYQQKWHEAEKGMQLLHELNPENKIYRIYYDRIQQLKDRDTYDEAWDGVFTHNEK